MCKCSLPTQILRENSASTKLMTSCKLWNITQVPNVELKVCVGVNTTTSEKLPNTSWWPQQSPGSGSLFRRISNSTPVIQTMHSIPKIVLSCALSGSKLIKYPPCLQKWLPALLAAVPKQLVNDRVYPTKSPSWGGTSQQTHLDTQYNNILYQSIKRLII